MALATGDAIVKWSGWVTLESSGSSISAGAMSSAASTECTSSNHEDAPLIEFGLECAFGANTPTEGRSVELYAKINTVTGVASEDGNVPTSTHKHYFLGSRRLKASAGTQYLHFGPMNLPAKEFDVYVFNNDDTDAMTWQLYMNPRSSAAKA
jgi:hypothetical protein